MALFLLDCDSVTSGASSLDAIAKELSNVESSVSGYDTSCEDGFDFASAKSIIASNLEACSTKVQNSSKLVNSVVTSHISLQNKLIYGKKEEEQKKAQESTSTGGGTSGGGGGYYSGGGGGYFGGGGGGGYVTAAATTTAGATQLRLIDTVKEIKTEVKEVECIPYDKTKLTKEAQELFDDEKFKYNSDGYAMLDNRYIISCDESFGEVGDRITFVREDGTKVDCIIGQITKDAKDKNKVSFFGDEKTWKKDNANNITLGLAGGISKIVNIGKLRSFNKSIQSAMDWAINIANDNSHGYSQQTRWGNPNYDCSSLVISAYEAAGVPVKAVGASYTGNMRAAFTKVGFECYDFGKVQLQPGDVLLRNGHTEMYVGDGKNVGAHSNYDCSNGDSSGNEISVSNTGNNWTWVLRYKGNDKTVSV